METIRPPPSGNGLEWNAEKGETEWKNELSFSQDFGLWNREPGLSLSPSTTSLLLPKVSFCAVDWVGVIHGFIREFLESESESKSKEIKRVNKGKERGSKCSSPSPTPRHERPTRESTVGGGIGRESQSKEKRVD